MSISTAAGLTYAMLTPVASERFIPVCRFFLVAAMVVTRLGDFRETWLRVQEYEVPLAAVATFAGHVGRHEK